MSTVDRAREAVLSHGLSDPGGSEPAVLGIDDGRAFASTMIDDRTVGLALGGCRWIMTMRPADALGAAVVVMGLDAIAVLAGAALSRPGDLAEEPG